jgi:hypothetical protein
MKNLSFLFIYSLIFLSALSGQNPGKKTYTAGRIQTAPVINGILDDEAWLTGTWIDDFTQFEPYNGKAASQRTEFKVLFDDNNLYVAIKALDTNPDSIVTRLSRRDQADGDLAGIIIDSFHDLRTGFLFGVSAAGVKYDHIFTNDGQKEDPSWDPNWWVKTAITAEGWVAEMKIPFSQVRFEKNSGDVWGFQVARLLYRKSETSFWQHIPKESPGIIHLLGELKGLEQIRPRKIFDMTPYAVARMEKFKPDPENPFRSKGRLSGMSGGIDSKIGVTNNMTMDLSINPDFGQVEADPSEVNLTAYETFFAEKRPFFIEGNHITNFGLGIGDGDVGNDNLFYSRRIGRQPQGDPELKDGWHADIPITTAILGAAKLTGKTRKGLSLGIVEATTAEERAAVDTSGGRRSEKVEPLTNYFMGRVQKDMNEGKTIIGGIFTAVNRDLDADLSRILHKSAYTGGADFTRYFRDKSWMFNINAAFSLVEGSKEAILSTQESSARYFQRPDKSYAILDSNRTALAGSGGRMQIMKLNGHWNLMYANIWKTPGFEVNDMGYLREADQLLSVLWGSYNEWNPKGIYRNYNISCDVYSFWNFGGDNQGKGTEWNSSMTLKNFWNVWLGGSLRGTSLSSGMLRGGPMMKIPGSISWNAGFSTDSRRKLIARISAYGSEGFNNSSGNFYSGVEISAKPINYLSIAFSPGYNKSSSQFQYITKEKYLGSDRFVFAAIDRKTVSASFRINLNLTPDLTFQYWGQPFLATGKYSDYKYIVNPMADDYKGRYRVYSPMQIKSSGDNFDIDEDIDGTADYSISRDDFNLREFLSNLVIRWEYNPGSSVYLVWSQKRSSSGDTGNLDISDDLGVLFNRSKNRPVNIFLIKFSYRFGLK